MSTHDGLVSAELMDILAVTMGRLSDTSMVPACQGNFSARDRQTGHIVIAPHACPYDDMTTEDLVITHADGHKSAGRLDPSYGTEVHELQS